MSRISEAFVEQIEEDYMEYLDKLEADRMPISYEAFEWEALRNAEEEAMMRMEDYCDDALRTN